MPAPSLIKQIAFARICGVSKQTVSKAVKAGHIKVNKARKVVLNHEKTELWMEKQAARQALSEVSPQILPEESEKNNKTTEKETLKSLAHDKIVEEIGRIRAERRLKELKYSKERGDLIERDTLASVLFHFIDALNINMLDIPDMVIDSLIDKVKAKASRGDLIKIMRDKIEKEIKNTKKQVQERLK